MRGFAYPEGGKKGVALVLGNHSYLMNADSVFGPAVVRPFGEEEAKAKRVWVEVDVPVAVLDYLNKAPCSHREVQTFVLDTARLIKKEGKRTTFDQIANTMKKEEAVTVVEEEGDILLEDRVLTRPNGEEYRCRWVRAAASYDVDMIKNAVKAGLVPYLFGVPGTGKTAMVEAAFGNNMYTVVGDADTDASAFFGSWVQVDDRYVYIEGPLLRAMIEGKILYIDEIGLIDARVISLLYPLMDGRGWVNVPGHPTLKDGLHAAPGFAIVAAGNPNAIGVRVSEALLSRLTFPVEVTTDHQIAAALGVSDWIIKISTALESVRVTEEVSWAPQMREMLVLQKTDELLGTAAAVGVLMNMAPNRAVQDQATLLLQSIVGLDSAPLKV